ncbi:hypothetical protein AAZV13_03G212800 [Glycine max]
MTNSEHKAVVFFRTTTPDHFENREWFSGGCCNRAVPFKEDQVEVSYVDSIMRGIELEEFHKAKNSTSANNLKLLDTTGLRHCYVHLAKLLVQITFTLCAR